MKLKVSGLFLLIALVQGCASMSKEECQTSDWEERGRQDGVTGKHQSYLSKHTEACAEHGITPDSKAYRKGWSEGITEFCTPQNGFELGKNEKSFDRYKKGTCPKDLEKIFFRNYQIGKKIIELENLISQTEQKIKNNDALILDGKTTQANRAKYLYENKDSNRDLLKYRVELRKFEKMAPQ